MGQRKRKKGRHGGRGPNPKPQPGSVPAAGTPSAICPSPVLLPEAEAREALAIEPKLGWRFAGWVSGLSWPFWLLLGIFLLVPKCIAESTFHNVQKHGDIYAALGAIFCNLAAEGGIALIVFAFVSITVEAFARVRVIDEHSRQLREIKESVFYNVLEYAIGRNVLLHLKEHVFSQSWLRTDLQLNYEFKICPGNKEKVIVRTTWSYRIHNLSNSPQEREISHYFQNVSEHDLDKILHFEIRDGDDTICHLEKSGAPIQATVYAQERQRGVNAKVKVMPGRPLTVTFIYDAVRRLEETESVITLTVADSVTVRVQIMDKQIPSLEFQAESAHVVDPRETGDFPKETTVREWRLDGPLLPGHGFILNWRPTPPKPLLPKAIEAPLV